MGCYLFVQRGVHWSYRPSSYSYGIPDASAESIFIVLSNMILPSFMCGLVVSGIFAASMSSSSSYLLISGSAVAENIYRGLIKKDATDSQVMIVARLTLVAVLLFGIVIALDENSSIFQVVSYAWAGFGASFGPLIIMSLYWRRTNLQGAFGGYAYWRHYWCWYGIRL